MAADDAPPGPRHLAHAHTDPLAGVTGVYTPPHLRRTASPFRPPPLDPVVLDGHRAATPASPALGRAVAEESAACCPSRLAHQRRRGAVGRRLVDRRRRLAHYQRPRAHWRRRKPSRRRRRDDDRQESPLLTSPLPGSSADGGSSGMSAAIIAGAVVGGVAFLTICALSSGLAKTRRRGAARY
ncbi:predicted protein [Verticillium alfalfae VaMs.102]|uniref:Predicted protein n=1 Tax=Verticillium alfalfae (strain VaMs.102 / ATCC MYA-4576 / FGSC 10136) TaxID=526221 RepID=C9SXV4_VERA1|nr:predicted protein [Verticillium alfalfae VaMs.102]EEY23619.1 predicted protein [Verticillium alfalfae VaMs.102]